MVGFYVDNLIYIIIFFYINDKLINYSLHLVFSNWKYLNVKKLWLFAYLH